MAIGVRRIFLPDHFERRARPTAGRTRPVHKLLIEVPALGLRLPSFGLALLLACASALWLTAWRAKREGLDPESVYELAIWLMGGGFVGARLLYVAAHPESIHGLGDALRFWQGGIVYYGCILGGLIGSLIYWLRHPFPFRPMADAVAPALAIGSAVGRVGCFLNGCCYGGVTDRPWALSFPAGSPPWARHVHDGLLSASATRSLPTHPTQLYSAADGLLLLALLTAFYPRRRRDGEVMALLMVTYPVTRFLTECVRGDEPAVIAGLTLSQAISVVIFVGGLAVWAHLLRQPKGRFADAARAGQPAPTAVPPPAFSTRRESLIRSEARPRGR
jgi:phosphatidylglycerol:prolipoprotein diacylglycerol transferase